MDVEVDDIDVEAMLREICSSVEHLLADRPVELDCSCDAAAARLRSDPGKVHQIVLNLASNAAEFTERGRIAVRAEPADGGVCVTVSDTGPGIGPDHLDTIFEEFEQLEAHRSSGTGLGLTITRALCELLGGCVTVTSQVGAGSTFTVVLPHLPHLPDGADGDAAGRLG